MTLTLYCNYQESISFLVANYITYPNHSLESIPPCIFYNFVWIWKYNISIKHVNFGGTSTAISSHGSRWTRTSNWLMKFCQNWGCLAALSFDSDQSFSCRLPSVGEACGILVWFCRWKMNFGPRDQITETENGFMDPKYLSFRMWLYTPCSSSDVRWARILREGESSSNNLKRNLGVDPWVFFI